jgi:ribonucleoside-diphosphate reductase subunit M2
MDPVPTASHPAADQVMGDSPGKLDLSVEKSADPLLAPSYDRFCLFPVQHNDVFQMYKRAVASYWTTDEVDLADDLKHWARLTPDEQHFIKHVLAFFASSDGVVNENLALRFMHDVQLPEARAFYAFQVAIETVHSEMYSLLIETYVQDLVEKKTLFGAISQVRTVQRNLPKWPMGFGSRLLRAACSEYIWVFCFSVKDVASGYRSWGPKAAQSCCGARCTRTLY